MPRGSAPGERRGGRAPGVPNKKTQEALLRQAREASEAQKSGRKLARDVLDEFMHLTAGMAAFYQPTAPGQPQNPNENEGKFWQCVEMTRDFAKALAPYQSPTFRAISVVTSPDQQRPALPPPAGATVISIDDPAALQRVYKNRIQKVG